MKCFILKVYKNINYLRRVLYQRGIIKSFKSDKFVISIGNITMGGSGKTPFTIYLAKLIKKWGFNVAVLTVGYGRKGKKEILLKGNKIKYTSKEAGDEPLLISNNLRDVPVVVSKNRIKGIKLLERDKIPIDVFILDDGFQFLKLERDIDIVLLDATNPFFYSKKLGCNLLRESEKSLKFSDLIVVTKSNLGGDIDINKLIGNYGKAIFKAGVKTEGIYNFHGKRVKDFSRKSVSLISGIGNNFQFEALLKSMGFFIMEKYFFDDHHVYKRDEIKKILSNRKDEEVFMTTEKDFIKLCEIVSEEFYDIFFYLKIKVDIINEKEFENYLYKRLQFKNHAIK